MLTPRQFETFASWRRVEIRSNYVFIPRNRFGIQAGYYRDADIVDVLRNYWRDSKALLFIAQRVAAE